MPKQCPKPPVAVRGWNTFCRSCTVHAFTRRQEGWRPLATGSGTLTRRSTGFRWAASGKHGCKILNSTCNLTLDFLSSAHFHSRDYKGLDPSPH